ncbi:Hypothetical protein IALB_1283 [Ignavibacterium album JCM 16511]|uniref:Uncharacterized protein n=1 Tax=Ignavibacterium album (strain DSM 19864 / JCM 16511 / NBRC 101810 / Mat9-16) TaxID=945713 RepID=I0AJ36_IGNAJ|nr:hypothetical protein [Ignavibacterium album]AFH48993.1 Hypothetical protein IALB_1283 [Ignavibacterium album JCM 16511]
MPLGKVQNIIATENFIIISATYTTLNSCWSYDKNEILSNDTTITLKVYAKYDVNYCPDVLSSIIHTDTIYLSSAGYKKIKFWQSDPLYKDTTIVFAANYNITFPYFFIEKGSDSDSSYISLRDSKIHPYLFEVEATGWGVIEKGILSDIVYKRKEIFS